MPPSVREPPTKKAAPAAPPAVISVPPPQLLRDLKHAAAGYEAMSALVQYLVHTVSAPSFLLRLLDHFVTKVFIVCCDVALQVGAFSVTSLKSELERANKEWAHAKEDLGESMV